MRPRPAFPATLFLVGVALLATGSAPLPRLSQEPPVAPRAGFVQVGTPTLLASASDDEPAGPLKIGRVSVQVTVAGLLARTTTTLTFENEHDRALEGELVFPLPEGATVSGYGLDVDGEMVDAVVVERQAARVAFEQEVRRGIDPGLVEWVRGNSFRTRVWPIPAHGRRTVKVEYVSELAIDTGGAVYRLPLRYSMPVHELDLRIEVIKGLVTPEVQASQLANFRFEAWQDRYVASTRLQDKSLSDDLVVSLPRLPSETAVVEKHADGQYYFVINAAAPPSEASPARGKPRRVGMLWDASSSHVREDVKRELDVVKAWLGSLGDVEVVLTVFRNVPEPARTLTIHGGDSGPLLAALTGEPYDGGTNLDALSATPGVAYYVLVSDGLANIGRGLPEHLGAPVYALSASRVTDPILLTHVARKSGGRYLNLGTLTAQEAADRIGRTPAVVASLEYDRSALTDVLPAEPEPVEDRVRVTGRLLLPETPATLRYRTAAGTTAEKTFQLRQTSTEGSGLVPRFWAQHKAAELSVFPARHGDELTSLGKAFGIVTPNTSLLVLETLDQYLRHGIEPPPSRGELRTEYLRLVSERKAEKVRTREKKIEDVLTMWQRRVTWWESKPSPTPLPTAQPIGSPSPRPRPSTPPAQRLPAIDCAGARPVLQGKITDSAGAGLPGVTVTAIDTDTAAEFAVVSRSDGSYGLCNLPPATYAIRMELTGFTPHERRMSLPARAPVIHNVTLSVGALTETVEVTGETPAVEKTSTGIAPSSAIGASSIEIAPWDPATPYLAAMKAAGPAKAYAAYLAERDRYGSSPAFYLDCAGHLLGIGKRALAVRVLTSILDLKLEEPRLLRVVAHRLQQMGELDLAIELFEQVLRLRPEEPQSPRDLALAHAARGDAARAGMASPSAVSSDYLQALELFNTIVLGEWDGRFSQIEVVALMDANRLIAIMERDRLPSLDRVALDPRLRKDLDVDVRIILTWDTDDTDLDLWVTEPTGEKCDYSHNRTAIGGMVSDDFTDGYGPEEYLVRRAPPGIYRIQANFYGSRSASLIGPTTAQATVITHFGRPEEDRRTLTLRLTDAKEVVDIGSVRFGSIVRTKRK